MNETDTRNFVKYLLGYYNGVSDKRKNFSFLLNAGACDFYRKGYRHGYRGDPKNFG